MRKQARRPRHMDSMGLREKFLDYVGYWFALQGTTRERVTGLKESLSRMVEILIYGKKPEGGSLIDLDKGDRLKIKNDVVSLISKEAKGSDAGLIDDNSWFLLDMIDEYATAEASARGGYGDLMAIINGLVEDMDDFVLEASMVDPSTILEGAEERIGPGYFKLIAKGTRDGEQVEEFLVALQLDEDTSEKLLAKLNEHVRDLYEVKGEFDPVSSRKRLTVLTSDPGEVLWEGGQKIKAPKYSTHFGLAATLTATSCDRISRIRQEVIGLSGNYDRIEVILSGIVSEMRQSEKGLSMASKGVESLDLDQLSPTKTATIEDMEKARLRALLSEAFAVLDRLESWLKQDVINIDEDERDQEGDRELRLLRWEIALATGVAARGKAQVEELLSDRAFWSEPSAKESLPEQAVSVV